MKMKFLPIAYVQGEFKPFEDANISIATHALHYGTAAFGGLRGHVDPKNPDGATLFRIDKHVNRLKNSGTFLQADFTEEQIEKAIVEFIKKNKPTKPFYIRPLIYLSDTGIAPRVHNAEKDLLIYGLEMDDYLPAEGVKVCFSSWMRQPDNSMPLRGKISGAYITSSLAKTEAIERGFDEAILLRTDGKVSEASAMNLFIVRDGTVFTPGVDQDILEGITRASIIEVCKDLEIPVVERQIDKSELYIADEVFLSGTAARITPVSQVESTKKSVNGEITKKLKAELDKISRGNHPKYKHWSTKISY